MLIKHLLATLLLICFTITLQAQTETIIFGSVRDPDLNEKLIGVTVKIDSIAGTVTDVDGKYRINVKPGTHKITFSFIGYENTVKTVKVKEGELKQLDSKMVVSHNELDVVVVSGSQYEKKLAQETMSMDVLGKDLINNTNSRDVADVLGKDPGVQVQDGQISIRGGSSYSYGVGTRTAVTVDGQSYASADLGEAQSKFAPIENAEQIEVIKGASSVAYGSSAIDGVVNVITAWPKGDKPVTNITSYVGLYTKPVNDSLMWWSGRQPGYMGTYVVHKQKIGQLQLVVGGNVDYVQSYLESADEFRVRVNFKTRYVPLKHPTLSFGLNGNVQKESSGRFFIGKSETPDSAYRVSQGSDDKYVRTDITPHFTYQGENGHRYELRINYLNVFRKGNGADINASSNAFNMTNEYQYKYKKLVVVTVGLPLSFGFSKSNLYKGTFYNYAAATFVQGELNYKRLSLVAGVRYEVTAVDTFLEKGIPVFRSGINFRAGKGTFLRASWGQGYRLPTVGERYVAAQFTQGIYVVPNPDLKAEKSWNLELGIKQGMRIRNWNAFFDFSTFWSEYDKFVQYDFGYFSNLYATGDTIFPGQPDKVVGLHPTNLDRARVFGFEASFVSQGNIGPVKLTTLIGYTYTYPGDISDSTQRDVGKFLSNAFRLFPKKLSPLNPDDSKDLNKLLILHSRHLVRGDIQLDWKQFSIGTTVYFNSFSENFGATTKIAIQLLGGGPVSYNKYIQQHLDGDFVMDLRAGYTFSEKVKLIMMAKNLTNKFYLDRPGKPSPPRCIVLQVNITL